MIRYYYLRFCVSFEKSTCELIIDAIIIIIITFISYWDNIMLNIKSVSVYIGGVSFFVSQGPHAANGGNLNYLSCTGFE